jgi:hypothetical protein
MAVAIFGAAGCTTIRSLEFKSSGLEKGLSNEQVQKSWRAAIERGAAEGDARQLILVRHKTLGRRVDPCRGGKQLRGNVWVIPGDLSEAVSHKPIRKVELFEGLDVGSFRILYRKSLPALDQVVRDVRQLLEVTNVDFAECVIEADNELESNIRSERTTAFAGR